MPSLGKVCLLALLGLFCFGVIKIYSLDYLVYWGSTREAVVASLGPSHGSEKDSLVYYDAGMVITLDLNRRSRVYRVSISVED